MRLIKFIVYALTLLIGISIGFIIRGHIITKDKTGLRYLTVRESGFKYINPLLDFQLSKDSAENVELKPFRHRIKKFIKDDLNKKWADDISLYYRDLNNGPWFSIGQTEKFYPASLLKVPLMIAVLKQAETDPKILREKIHYNNPALQAIQNKVSNAMEFGKYYTVEELLYRMIVYSDNIPTNLLENFVNLNILEKTYNDLGITDPYNGTDRPDSMVVASTSYTISAETYASFFRILYNASYLNREMSEKALGFLTNTDFKDGLVAGVPPNIVVAHKWGYRTLGSNDEIKQLHDCGIIYHPNHPYLLCVMTSGSAFEYLDDALRELSRVVYEEVDHQHLQHK